MSRCFHEKKLSLISSVQDKQMLSLISREDVVTQLSLINCCQSFVTHAKNHEKMLSLISSVQDKQLFVTILSL